MVSVKVFGISDYCGEIQPPQGAVAAIIVRKDGEDLVPVFVRSGIPVEITEIVTRAREPLLQGVG